MRRIAASLDSRSAQSTVWSARTLLTSSAAMAAICGSATVAFGKISFDGKHLSVSIACSHAACSGNLAVQADHRVPAKGSGVLNF